MYFTTKVAYKLLATKNVNELREVVGSYPGFKCGPINARVIRRSRDKAKLKI